MTWTDQFLETVKETFAALGTPYQIGRQDNEIVANTSFQRSTMSGRKGRVYCHLSHLDKRTGRRNVFILRFKAGSDPKSWFKQRTVPKLVLDWCGRFERQYSEEQGAPPQFREPGSATDQFGLTLTAADANGPRLSESLGILIEIAVECVSQSMRREGNRDWTRFNSLTT